jgi:hypothetical protein
LFFAKHQLNYLADIVRVLVYTGRKINVYDVLVAWNTTHPSQCSAA